MSGNTRKGKKRPKSYYLKCSQQNKRRPNRLDTNLKGFLLTCNSHEKDAVREAYSILNEYADQLYGPEEVKEEKDAKEDSHAVDSDDDEQEEDIEVALKKEVESIKSIASSTQRRFQSVQTKAHNCLFIKTTLPNPSELAHAIFTDLGESQIQKSRYALRLLPINGTCKAYTKDISEVAGKLLIPEFQTPFGEGLTYSVVFKSRNNSDLSKTSVQNLLGQVIKTLNPLHHVSFDNPDVVVIVEVVGSVCCLGMARDFYKLRKYNLVEVVKQSVKNEGKKDDESDNSNQKGKEKDNFEDNIDRKINNECKETEIVKEEAVLESDVKDDTTCAQSTSNCGQIHVSNNECD